MTEHKSKVWAFGVSLLLGLASASLTACNNNQQENAASGMMGRLTSVSDTKVIVEVFDRPSNAVSGQAADGSRASDGNMGRQKPEGTPPADRPERKQETRDNSQNEKEPRKGESKTFVLSEDTKIYKQEGEEKTEISAEELELGSMLSIVAEGDTAEVITVQSGGNRQKRKDF